MEFNFGLTKFLSPEEQKLLANSKLNYTLSAIGYERKRAFIFQDEAFDVDFKISIIEIIYNKHFFNLTHQMILGSLIGLGIKRECIGDIYIGEKTYFLIIGELERYILTNLEKIDRANVKLEVVGIDDLNNVIIDPYINLEIIVTSLRLDVIVSNITHLSREKAKEYIKLQNVKINGNINTNIDTIIKEDDLISIHRYGRIIVDEIVRKTKKNKYVLLIRKTK